MLNKFHKQFGPSSKKWLFVNVAGLPLEVQEDAIITYSGTISQHPQKTEVRIDYGLTNPFPHSDFF